MSVTFLSAWYWLTHLVELSYTTVLSAAPPDLRTVRVDLSLSLRSTLPSQRACLAALAASCANTVVAIGRTNSNANNNANRFFSMFLSLSPGSPATKFRTTTLAPKNERHPKGAADQRSLLKVRKRSIENFAFALLGNQLIEGVHDLIAARHDRLNFILAEEFLVFFGEGVH